jgi:hypothetical protein
MQIITHIDLDGNPPQKRRSNQSLYGRTPDHERRGEGGSLQSLPTVEMTQTRFGRQEYIFCNSDEKILPRHRFHRIDFFHARISSIVELICCERGREDPRTKSIQALTIKLIFHVTWPLDSILGSNSIP